MITYELDNTLNGITIFIPFLDATYTPKGVEFDEFLNSVDTFSQNSDVTGLTTYLNNYATEESNAIPTMETYKEELVKYIKEFALLFRADIRDIKDATDLTVIKPLGVSFLTKDSNNKENVYITTEFSFKVAKASYVSLNIHHSGYSEVLSDRVWKKEVDARTTFNMSLDPDYTSGTTFVMSMVSKVPMSDYKLLLEGNTLGIKNMEDAITSIIKNIVGIK